MSPGQSKSPTSLANVCHYHYGMEITENSKQKIEVHLHTHIKMHAKNANLSSPPSDSLSLQIHGFNVSEFRFVDEFQPRRVRSLTTIVQKIRRTRQSA
jgi:hypothetical protein